MLAEVMDESIFCGATLETEVVLGRVDDKGRTWAGDGGADVDAERNDSESESIDESS